MQEKQIKSHVKFSKRLDQVRRFYKENGHGWIPARYDTEPNSRFGYWANTIRYNDNKKPISPKRKEALENAGFAFRKPTELQGHLRNLVVIPRDAQEKEGDAVPTQKTASNTDNDGGEDDTDDDVALILVSPMAHKNPVVPRTIARPQNHPASVESLATLIDGRCRFGTILADPPWRYGNKLPNGAAEQHSSTMSIDTLCQMPVLQLAETDAWLFLWATSPLLPYALKLMEAWGFSYKTNMVWGKTRFGMGNYWRSAHELLLLGVRGSPKPWLRHDIGSFTIHSQKRHSAKPHWFRDMVTSVVDGPYLEMFGREDATGWTVFRNQVQPPLFSTQNEDTMVLSEAQTGGHGLPVGKHYPDPSFRNIFSIR